MDLYETILKLSGVPYEGSPVEKFMNGLKSISREHPLDPGGFIIDDCAVHASPAEGNTKIHISDMASMIRGSGTKALEKMCVLADECGVVLRLVAKGYADTPTKKLVAWYERYGFTKTGLGSLKDGFRMERQPVKKIKLRGFDRPH